MKKKSNKGLPKAKFTKEDDEQLVRLVNEYGPKNWKYIASMMFKRTPRQCKERWNNYINPNLNTSSWTKEEDEILIRKYAEYGSQWSKILPFLDNRSKNGLKLRFKLLEKTSRRTDYDEETRNRKLYKVNEKKPKKVKRGFDIDFQGVHKEENDPNKQVDSLTNASSNMDDTQSSISSILDDDGFPYSTWITEDSTSIAEFAGLPLLNFTAN